MKLFGQVVTALALIALMAFLVINIAKFIAFTSGVNSPSSCVLQERTEEIK